MSIRKKKNWKHDWLHKNKCMKKWKHCWPQKNNCVQQRHLKKTKWKHNLQHSTSCINMNKKNFKHSWRQKYKNIKRE